MKFNWKALGRLIAVIGLADGGSRDRILFFGWKNREESKAANAPVAVRISSRRKRTLSLLAAFISSSPTGGTGVQSVSWLCGTKSSSTGPTGGTCGRLFAVRLDNERNANESRETFQRNRRNKNRKIEREREMISPNVTVAGGFHCDPHAPSAGPCPISRLPLLFRSDYTSSRLKPRPFSVKNRSHPPFFLPPKKWNISFSFTALASDFLKINFHWIEIILKIKKQKPLHIF